VINESVVEGGECELELGRETRFEIGVCVRETLLMLWISEVNWGWRVVASGNTNCSTWLWGEL
jgi:hypothetical protein